MSCRQNPVFENIDLSHYNCTASQRANVYYYTQWRDKVVNYARHVLGRNIYTTNCVLSVGVDLRTFE